MEVQIKLLRVLQEREFERVGGRETIQVDVRVVSSTHRHLEKMVSDGTFREDLYYRLNVFPITLPPLRDRPGDIVPLAMHFIDKFARSMGKAIEGFDPAVLARLSGYAWPGNVRELEHVIERAMILARGERLTAADLDFGGLAALPTRPMAQAGSAPPAAEPLAQRLSEQERGEIVSAVAQAQSNIAQAARALGINRSTLYYRMRKHGLEHLLPTTCPPEPDGTG
jgi:transcriptional regulator with PAS, ATPase and Fis domain